jgi:HEPN domain-containing protein
MLLLKRHIVIQYYLIMNRAHDWLEQAKLDLEHAKKSRTQRDFNWSCFACQQAAEKAIKALYLSMNMEGWGHVIKKLLEELKEETDVPDALIKAGIRLDKFYIPTRYPHGFDSGKPSDFYNEDDADEGIKNAENIIKFCEEKIRSQR